jgi:6-phosphogluconolactonase
LVANRKIELFANGMEIAHRTAAEVVRIASEAAAARGAFTIALSGGSTPKVLYALLAGNPALR